MTQIRRTRIVCTIGPSSSSPAVLRTMISAGMDVARMNFSHGDHQTHREVATNVREAAEANNGTAPSTLTRRLSAIRLMHLARGSSRRTTPSKSKR